MGIGLRREEVRKIMGVMRSWVKSFGHALRGAWVLVRSEPHAWVHAAATVVVCGAGFYFRLDRGEWLWIVAAIAWVWVAEAMNTAIERVCDALHPEQHPLIRDAKDVAAAGVLVAAIAAAVVGVVVFWGRVSQ